MSRKYYCVQSVYTEWFVFFFNFIAQKVSNINLVTKDYIIVPLTNLLKLLLAGRIMGVGGGVGLVRFM